jgi:hypothetical protein
MGLCKSIKKIEHKEVQSIKKERREKKKKDENKDSPCSH